MLFKSKMYMKRMLTLQLVGIHNPNLARFDKVFVSIAFFVCSRCSVRIWEEYCIRCCPDSLFFRPALIAPRGEFSSTPSQQSDWTTQGEVGGG
jgi:hypothetical protein